MSPLSPGTPLFKTAAGESLNAAPPQPSPFSASPFTDQGSLLTVGDILPQLPPEIARTGALAPEQPVAISAQVLDAALRSGQAAVPIFEVYRICPALFQAPVSPQDPRMVPLPASKLPRLIASAQLAQGSAPTSPPAMATAASSPFGAAVQSSAGTSPMNQMSASPFGTAVSAMPQPQATALPPRRHGPPPSLGDVQSKGVPPLSLPNAPGQAPAAGPAATPQTMNAPFGTSGPTTFGGIPGADPSASAPNPFGSPVSAKPNPFGAVAPGHSASPPLPAAPSAPGAPRTEGFANLFGGNGGPAGQSAPDPTPAPSFASQPAPAASSPFGAAGSVSTQPPSLPSSPAATSTMGHIRVGLASLLKGYTATDLGFDPLMVPSWIMTTLPAATVRAQIATGNVVAEVGTLVDSISDLGFRKLLATARRDFQVKLPTNELFHALSGTNPSTLGSLAKPMTPPPSPGEPGTSPFGSSMRPEAVPLFSEAGHAAPPLPAASSSPFQPQASRPVAPLEERPAESVFNRPAVPPAFPSPAEQQSPIQFQAASYNPFAASRPPAGTQPSGGHPIPTEGFSSEQLLATYSDAPPPRPTSAASIFGSHDEAAPPSSQFFQPQAAPTEAFSPAASPPEPMFEPQRSNHPVRQPERFLPQGAEAPWSPGVAAAPPDRPTGMPAPSFVGVQRVDTNTDQILLRALLGTDETLTPQRVVELTGELPGIASCVCIHGQRSLSHAGAHKPQARDFQRQAIERAQHLRSLAPLIGIEGAETFTLNAGDRLMTFCFPDNAILGVLHDVEPSLGLRDKITLIARELARMLA